MRRGAADLIAKKFCAEQAGDQRTGKRRQGYCQKKVRVELPRHDEPYVYFCK
jgi:hypothetical protein